MVKINNVIVLLLFWCNTIYSQKSAFEKGYFIDNNNTKVECLIKNMDWNYNPNQFEYKTDENAMPKIMAFTDFQEFSVGEEYKFVKANVKIDKTIDKTDNATALKAMNYVDDLLLLRVRVEGKATLYSYNNGEYLRFFYRNESDKFIPLSYKIYYNSLELNYAKNETYKQELLNALKCENITQTDVDKLEYSSSSLTDFFIKYNTCSGSLTDKFQAKRNYKTFELYVKLGVGMCSFSYNDGNNIDFDKKARLKFGAEMEFNLSNRFKKWSILVEPCYQQYSNSHAFVAAKAVVDYKSIDISLGVRRYMILNSKSNFFVNAYYTFGHSLNSKIDLTNNSSNYLKILDTLNPSLGLGYMYDKKYTLEVRYEFKRELFDNTYIESNFNTIGIMLGYKLL